MSTDVERINEAALALLQEPGVRMEHDEICRLLLSNGAREGSGSNVIRFPRPLVEDAIARCPSCFTLADRFGGGKTVSPDGESVIWSVPGMNIYEGGVARPFTSADLPRWARLLHRLPNVDGIFSYAMEDVPATARDVVGLKIISRNSTKHIRVFCFTPEGAEVMTEMKAVVGDYPWFSIGFTAHGPLRWTNLALEIFRRTAGAGIPATVNGEPMAGVSGPVTLAGSCAVGTAEILAGIVVNQLLEPGRPCIFNLGLAHTFDMRTAIAVTGGPENALYARAAAELGRFYGIPSSSWVSTESMLPDSQAALEKMFGFATHLLNRVSIVWSVGQLESEVTVSPAQAVLDDEMIGFTRRYLRGMDVNDDTLAIDAIREIGIAGSFLEHPHTMQHFRSELFEPSVLFRRRRSDWESQGSPTAAETAEQRARELADGEPESGLSDEQLMELDRLADEFLKKV